MSPTRKQIPGFELQERGSTAEPKVFMEERLTGQKHHVIIRRQRDRPLDRPDSAEFPNPVLSDPHAVIEFTRDGRVSPLLLYMHISSVFVS